MSLARNVVIAGALAIGLAGCFRPLYGSPEFNGLAAQQSLAGVQVDVRGERLAHYLRNELEFALRGGNPTNAGTRYNLAVSATPRTGGAIVDRVSGVAETAALFIDARYILTEPGKSQPINEGVATVVVSYDRSLQRFANTRAARDAEIQGARQLAEQIRSRVASFLATR
ncbi:MAG: LPS assembly lipoprotein LptE [Beijerinckiaceae bacterium]